MANRNYPDNGYPSVTQVLGILRKPGLEQWFLSNTRKFCMEQSNRGKLIGSQIHSIIQQYIETGKAKIETEYKGEVTNALKSFMLFRKEKPDIILKRAEIPLTSEKYKFNGTIDCLSDNMIADWKSAQAKDNDKPTIYDESLSQVSAYVYLYNEINNTNIDKAIIVSIAKMRNT